MASILKHLRSSTANKRPTASGLSDGQIAINTASGTPALFFKDNADNIVKVGPVHVGSTAPNTSPAGSAGNSTGELWVDDSLTTKGLKYYSGSAFINLTPSGTTSTAGLVELATPAETQAGTDGVRAVTPSGLQSKISDSTSTTSSTTIASATAVKSAYDLANAALPKNGGTVTGEIVISPSGSLAFEGSADDSFETRIAVVDPTADRTITLPNITGTVITTGDSGTVTSTMIADGTIVNADINASAAIAPSKLGSGALPNGVTVSSTNIVDGTIVNADINASAAIAGTKIDPAFGSNSITTDGAIVAGGANTAAAFIPTSNIIIPTNGLYSPSANHVAISTNTSERIRVDSSGRLLVGTGISTSIVGAQRNLQIEGTDSAASVSITRHAASASGPFLALAKTRGISNGSVELVSENDQLGSISFGGGDGVDVNTEGARIQAFVDGTPGADDMPGRLVFSTTADGASSPTERMRIDNAGRVLIGGTNTDPAINNVSGIALSATGTSQFSQDSFTVLFLNRRGTSPTGTVVDIKTGGTTVGTISVTASATAYNTSSDYRLKENVTPVTDGISRLQQLKPSRFNFIADPDTTVDGFIAHEVQAIVPEAITGEKDAVDDEGNPQYQGIDQSKLVPLLTAALQEAVAKIESLEARLTAAGL